MAKQKPWNQYEAVILLEAYVQVCEGKIDRKKLFLRSRAYYNGELRQKAMR
ncbi:MAG: hypothetical protein HFG82_03370 [Dorea sp.]|jgi:hypothetical protein|nr:hypothetical protein [Dorea sp.]